MVYSSVNAYSITECRGGKICIPLLACPYTQELKQKAAGAASPYSLEFFHFYPVAGVLIVIPSHLIHHVVPFREENKTRISISFECCYGTD